MARLLLGVSGGIAAYKALELIRLLRAYLRPYAGALTAVVLLQLVATMASLYLPSLNADIIDKGIATGDT